MLITPSYSKHFYSADGRPQYNASMKRVREEGLYPSVTTVMSVVEKPSITAWKISKMLEACVGVAQAKHILAESFIADAKARWYEETSSGAKLGTWWHEKIEEVLRLKNPASLDWPDSQTGSDFEMWLTLQEVAVEWVEFSCSSQLGYGCRVDMIGTWKNGKKRTSAVFDWKTQKTKDGKFTFYSDWGIQLAANAYACGNPDADLVSVGISTTEPIVKHKVWKNNKQLMSQFLNRFEVWKDVNSYDPLRVRY